MRSVKNEKSEGSVGIRYGSIEETGRRLIEIADFILQYAAARRSDRYGIEHQYSGAHIQK